MALWQLGKQDRRIEEDGRSAMWVYGGWVSEGKVGRGSVRMMWVCGLVRAMCAVCGGKL